MMSWSRSIAAGVNMLDSKIRDGEFKLILPYRLPLILGNDVAGIVVRVGRKVRRFKPGDEVYARPRQDRIGTYAEFIAMNEADVALKPKNLNMEEAASIPLVGLTVWQSSRQALRSWALKGSTGRDHRTRTSRPRMPPPRRRPSHTR